MFSLSCLLAVDYLGFDGALMPCLFTENLSTDFVGGTNPIFVPTETHLINKLSTVQLTNISTVNLEFSSLSTAPIRAITKYLNNLLLIGD
jgi:hypothetical protein